MAESKIVEIGESRLESLSNVAVEEHKLESNSPPITKRSLRRKKMIFKSSGERKSATARKHECALCGRSFKYQSALKTHERVHSGEKPYEYFPRVAFAMLHSGYGWNLENVVL
ncbi:unnamed protein product [Cyprideis torosa]|uniref:Uncharacterized protein n=1 Tax=Cyprideis torosa TaxID=163714 RepID=A0A7R8WHS6_9CRUS|nr:unnamed protein product [Cyprideis torosa]CAG0899757.1 unnamed protein product [Cyprideis torosa]